MGSSGQRRVHGTHPIFESDFDCLTVQSQSRKKMAVVHDMVAGLQRGHKVTKNVQPVRQNRKKGVNTAKSVFVREVVREVMGLAPYERRGIELLRISKDKRCLRFLKKRLGAHVRAKRKREELSDIIASQRKAAKH